MAPGDWYSQKSGWADWDNLGGTEFGHDTLNMGDPANLNISTLGYSIGGLLISCIVILVVCKACRRCHGSSGDVTYVREVSPDTDTQRSICGNQRPLTWWTRNGPVLSPQFVTVTRTGLGLPCVHSSVQTRGYFQGQGQVNWGQDILSEGQVPIDPESGQNRCEPSAPPPPFEHPPTYIEAVGGGHHGDHNHNSENNLDEKTV